MVKIFKVDCIHIDIVPFDWTAGSVQSARVQQMLA